MTQLLLLKNDRSAIFLGNFTAKYSICMNFLYQCARKLSLEDAFKDFRHLGGNTKRSTMLEYQIFRVIVRPHVAQLILFIE